MKLYGAIDLHSTNSVTVTIDEQDNVVYRKRLPNDFRGPAGDQTRLVSRPRGGKTNAKKPTSKRLDTKAPKTQWQLSSYAYVLRMC